MKGRFLVLLLTAVLLVSGCAVKIDIPDEPQPGSADEAVIQPQTDPDAVASAIPPEPVEPPQPAEPEPEPLYLTDEDVADAIHAALEKFNACSISAATIEHGEVSACSAWGWAERDVREMTTDTKVRVASLSKVAVAMGAMKAVEEGKLSLDAPLSDYWGESVRNPYSKGQPTARSLMTHTSTLMDLDPVNGLEKLRGILSSDRYRSFEPGNGGYWYYSNFGADVLGVTVELATEQRLDLYLREKFFAPMGVSASLHSGTFEESELATLYNNTYYDVARSAATQASFPIPEGIADGAIYYAGGLNISAPDLARLVCILAGDGVYDGTRYLSAESVAEMETPLFSVSQGEGVSKFEQCLILRRQDGVFGQSQLCYHTGSAYGAFTLLSYNPETGDGVVVLTVGAKRQTDEHGIYALCAAISETLYGKLNDYRDEVIP